MSRIDVDIHQPEFLPVEIHILGRLLDKHEQYQAQGRDLEARGVARSIGIVYEGLKGTDGDTEPTAYGDLNHGI
jgi:hypothetical protein